MVSRHIDNILTCSDHPITNAVAEGINSKLMSVKMHSSGFSNSDNFKAVPPPHGLLVDEQHGDPVELRGGQRAQEHRFVLAPGEAPERHATLARELRKFSCRRPRAGYRMATAALRRAGWEINPKRVLRVWREEGLKVPRRRRPKRRRGKTAHGSQLLRACRPDQVWSYDFVFDETEAGKRLKWLPICDEFTRESVALEVEHRMTALDVVRVLDAAVRERGRAPEYIRSDNGPEFIAKAVVDWVEERGFKTLFIEPGSPWQNCYSESFNSRFRDEFLDVELFGSLLEAKVLGKEFRHDYNHDRTHSSLGYLPPTEYAASCKEAVLATLEPPLCSIYPPKKPNKNQAELS